MACFPGLLWAGTLDSQAYISLDYEMESVDCSQQNKCWLLIPLWLVLKERGVFLIEEISAKICRARRAKVRILPALWRHSKIILGFQAMWPWQILSTFGAILFPSTLVSQVIFFYHLVDFNIISFHLQNFPKPLLKVPCSKYNSSTWLPSCLLPLWKCLFLSVLASPQTAGAHGLSLLCN